MKVSPFTRQVLVLFLVSRLATLVVSWVVMSTQRDLGLTEILTDWDGNFNEMIANHGYQQIGGFENPWLTLAFLPVLPLTTRGVHLVTGVGVNILGPAIVILCGLAAFVLLARFLSQKFGEEIALTTCALMLFSPNAFVFSMFYTEGPMLLFTVLTLRSLEERKWLWAGVFALVGGLTRPNGFVLLIPCVVAAVLEMRASQASTRWKAWIAPVIAPIGFVLWLCFVWAKTGSPTGYFDLQSEVWGARVDGGVNLVQESWKLVAHGSYNLDTTISVLAIVVFGIGGVVLGVRQKMNPVLLSFGIAVVVVTAMNARQSSGARFLLPAFPLFVVWAQAIPKRYFSSVVASSAVLMGALFFVSVTTHLYTP